MPPAPINLRVENDEINGEGVAIAWDPDPTQTGTVQKHDVQKVDAAGAITYLDFAPLSGSNRALIACPGGAPMDVQVTVKINNSTSAPSNRITLAPKPKLVCPPPPPPPAPLTAKQHLEAVIGGTLDVGSKVGVYLAPSQVLTVNADGSAT